MGFVDSQRNRTAGRQTEIIGGEPLLIHPVPGFMKHTEERRSKIRFHIPRGEADLARPERGAERVRGGVDAAGFEIEADLGGDDGVEGLLGCHRIGPGREFRWRTFRYGLRGERREIFPQRIEELRDGGGGSAALKSLKQRVVRLARKAPQIRFLQSKPHQRLKMRCEDGKVRGLPRRDPRMVPGGLRGGLAGDEIGGDLHGAVGLAADFAKVRGAHRVAAVVRFLVGFEGF